MATRNRYAEIMAQYAQSQPFSFFGYPQAYTGGYDVSQPQASAAPVTRYEEIMAQPAMAMGSGGRMTQADEGPTWSEPTSQQAYNWSQAGKNLTFISPLLGGLAGWYGNYLARNVDPNYSHEGRNYAAPTGGFLSSGETPTADSGVTFSTSTGDFSSQYGPDQFGPGISAGETLNRQMAQDRADAEAAQASAAAAAQAAAQGDTSNYSHEGGGGGGESGGGYSNANAGNYGWSRSGGGEGGGWAQGGHVSMQHLQGPNPAGPDDGYGALKDGEYVINDKAVKKYGIELMNAINSGKISKGKLRGLLEM